MNDNVFTVEVNYDAFAVEVNNDMLAMGVNNHVAEGMKNEVFTER